ncbi:MAG: hypothetical protein NZ750_08510 [Anaerolineae bacterium]|nr:hypothetical protein [Anaerolineae bacterium]MDW8172411.1 hypothetical protein [Anaerolineae bacterium]
MSRIMEVWEQTLRLAVDRDVDERENALFQIALVLERHSNPMEDKNYEGNLPRELVRLVLDERRQADTIHYLVALVRNKPGDSATVLFALSKARPYLLIGPLLALLRDKGMQFPSEANYEALQALDACLKDGSEAIVQAVRANSPREWLLRCTESKDDLLVHKAHFALARLDAMLSPPSTSESAES